MENYQITVSLGKEVHRFEVGEFLHHDGKRCKFRVFEQGMLVASFEPDAYQYLHICQNPGKVDKELLYLLANQIEAHHPHGVNTNLDQ